MAAEVCVWNITPVMIVRSIFEGIIDSEVGVEVPHMIGHHIDHNPDIPLMTGINEINEILLAAEVVVQPV